MNELVNLIRLFKLYNDTTSSNILMRLYLSIRIKYAKKKYNKLGIHDKTKVLCSILTNLYNTSNPILNEHELSNIINVFGFGFTIYTSSGSVTYDYKHDKYNINTDYMKQNYDFMYTIGVTRNTFLIKLWNDIVIESLDAAYEKVILYLSKYTI